MTTPILLSHYALIVMSLCPTECRGRKNQEIKGTFPDPLPPSGSQKGGGAGYARLVSGVFSVRTHGTIIDYLWLSVLFNTRLGSIQQAARFDCSAPRLSFAFNRSKRATVWDSEARKLLASYPGPLYAHTEGLGTRLGICRRNSLMSLPVA